MVEPLIIYQATGSFDDVKISSVVNGFNPNVDVSKKYVLIWLDNGDNDYISLSRNDATKLRDWLSAWLGGAE